MLSAPYGAVAQLVAHLHGMEGVRGSSPLSSTVRISRGRPTEVTVLGRFLDQPAAGTGVWIPRGKASVSTPLLVVRPFFGNGPLVATGLIRLAHVIAGTSLRNVHVINGVKQ